MPCDIEPELGRFAASMSGAKSTSGSSAGEDAGHGCGERIVLDGEAAFASGSYVIARLPSARASRSGAVSTCQLLSP